MKKKEKREIMLIMGCLLLVFIVAVVMEMYSEKKIISTGQAIYTQAPSYSGVVEMLQKNCGPIKGNGNCNTICNLQNKICIPINNQCENSLENNQCWCCTAPK